MTTPWWSRPGLEVRDGRLFVAGRDAESMARTHGTPLYAYDLVRIEEQAASLVDAFERAGVPFRLRMALKAQREPDVLVFVRALRVIGLDVCSPLEIEHGLTYGWAAEEMSFTGTNLSERDLDAIVPSGVHVNLDLLSQLDRFGRQAPGSTVGIRFNPRTGASSRQHAHLYTGGERPSKFGILEEQLDEALEIAHRHDLSLDTVHVHVNRTLLTDALPALELAVERAAGVARRLMDAGHPVSELNTGGGLGVPFDTEKPPLDLDAFAQIHAKHLGALGVTIASEPGDFLAKEMGVLLTEVVSLDDRDGYRFVGVDAGFNVAPGRRIYDEPIPLVLCRAADSPGKRPITVAGNINEGDDLWAEDLPMPEVREGDVFALLRVGSYNRSMHIDHCMRPPARTVAFAERA
jgi:diaminopimelate decarboxylase